MLWKRKHTNPINVRSFSSSKERDCCPMGILFNAKARHLKVSFPAKLHINNMYLNIMPAKDNLDTKQGIFRISTR